MVELLAPAGDFERLKFALLYGADAVYVGGTNFSLRANARNFSLDDLKEAVLYTHSLKKKIYVTVNIVLHENDLDGLREYLLSLDEIGIDAIICSDIVVMKLWRELNCKYELHISTQASITNSETAKFYKGLGATRVVLARECSKEDIKNIKEETNLELECFIHGAMCTSYSGKCVLSNYVTNRDSNRGGCAQVCRFTFLSDNDNLTYSMTPKDLNMVSNIKEMIKIGVNSFKVEGRMRSIYYIATVINSYRVIIDKIMNNELNDAYIKYYLAILNRCANRDSTPQFFDKIAGVEEQYFLGRKEESNQDFLGIVKSNENGIVTIEQRNYFKTSDVVEFFGPDTSVFTYVINEFYDEDLNVLDVARHPRMIIKFKGDLKVLPGDMMRLKTIDINDYL